MLEFIAEILFEITGYFFNPQKKLEKNVNILKSDPWFADLEDDFRYNHLIWYNRKVIRYLALDSNVEKLLKDDDERSRFKNLLTYEHIKFISGR